MTIAGEFAQLPPVAFPSGWQETVAKQLGLQPVSLLQCFIDVDGEPLIDRLVGLCREAQRIQRDIWFQRPGSPPAILADSNHQSMLANQAVVDRVLATPHDALISTRASAGAVVGRLGQRTERDGIHEDRRAFTWAEECE